MRLFLSLFALGATTSVVTGQICTCSDTDLVGARASALTSGATRSEGDGGAAIFVPSQPLLSQGTFIQAMPNGGSRRTRRGRRLGNRGAAANVEPAKTRGTRGATTMKRGDEDHRDLTYFTRLNASGQFICLEPGFQLAIPVGKAGMMGGFGGKFGKSGMMGGSRCGKGKGGGGGTFGCGFVPDINANFLPALPSPQTLSDCCCYEQCTLPTPTPAKPVYIGKFGMMGRIGFGKFGMASRFGKFGMSGGGVVLGVPQTPPGPLPGVGIPQLPAVGIPQLPGRKKFVSGQPIVGGGFIGGKFGMYGRYGGKFGMGRRERRRSLTYGCGKGDRYCDRGNVILSAVGQLPPPPPPPVPAVPLPLPLLPQPAQKTCEFVCECPPEPTSPPVFLPPPRTIPEPGCPDAEPEIDVCVCSPNRIEVSYRNCDPQVFDFVGFYTCPEDPNETVFRRHPDIWLYTCVSGPCDENAPPIFENTITFEAPFPFYVDSSPTTFPLTSGQCYVAVLQNFSFDSPPPHDTVIVSEQFIAP